MRFFSSAANLAAFCVLALGILPGCPNREVAKVQLTDIGVEEVEIPINLTRDIDILFVIDDSSSMAEEQASLIANFDGFIEKLKGAEGGLPNVHIGVVSTDMGAQEPGVPPIGASNCNEVGDEGRLQPTEEVSCTLPSNAFISDIEDPDTLVRTRNYPEGQLAEVFSCMADLGIDGCVFEQQLESMRAALDPALDRNPDFLRDDAYLGIVFITDEDDCSAHDPHIFTSEENSKDSDLGYAISYRCFEWGVQCEPAVGRDPGSYTGCVPREDSPYLVHPQEYVDFLLGLKASKRQIILAAITGARTGGDVDVIDRVTSPDTLSDDVEVEPSCNSSTGSAVPPIRIGYVLDQFEEQQTHIAEICQEDLSAPIEEIAKIFSEQLGSACVSGDLVDLDAATPGIQPECTVTQVIGEDETNPTVFPQCNGDLSNTPCWRMEPGECTPEETYPAQLRLVVERAGEPPPFGARLQLSCVVSR